VNEVQEDALASVYDEHWGEVEDTHRSFLKRFLSLLPPRGRVLDAACGTGKYFSLVLEGGHPLLGVDHAGAYLAKARETFPHVPTEKHDLQDIPYENEFDGVICVDAVEFIPPEDWPAILARFRRALRPQGALYLTVELAPKGRVRALNEAARDAGHPVVEGEVIWDEPEGPLYHYYPPLKQVRSWLTAEGFVLEDEAEGPWYEGEHAYHHVLARAQRPIPRTRR
jgi:SAM-dependent methyltransferase